MPFSVNAEILTSELAPNVSPYELLEQSRVNRKFYNAWQSNDLWLGFLKHYFPGKQWVIQEMEGLVLKSNQVKFGAVEGKVAPDGVVKAAFIRLAKELRDALRNGRLDYLVGCEPHAVDKAFMSRVLQCSESEQLNDKLRELCTVNGILPIVVGHTKTLQQLLLALYSDDEKRLIAVKDSCGHHKTLLHCAAQPPESLKVLLSLYPEGERLAAVKEKDSSGQTVLHSAAQTPDSLKVLLSLYPENERLAAVKEKNRFGETVLHSAVQTPDSLKEVLSLYPDGERLAAVKGKNRMGKTVLHCAANTPESLKVVLSLYPEGERLVAVKEKDGSSNTVLHHSAYSPDSLKVLLNLYPENERLAAVKEKNGSNQTVLHWATGTSDSLKVLLSLYPENERLAAVKEKNRFGETVLHSAAQTPDSLKEVLSLYPESERLAAVKEESGFDHTVLYLAAYAPGAPKELLRLLPEYHRFEMLRERVGGIPLAERLIGADLLLEDSFTQDYLLIYKLLNSKRDRVGFFSNATALTTLHAAWTQAQSFDEVKQGIINFLSHPEHSQSTLAQQLLNGLLTGVDKRVEALCAKWKTPPINQFTPIDVTTIPPL